MRPHSDADAPSVDRGVLARLKRLDPSLVVAWKKYVPDPLTGQPLLMNPGIDPYTGEELKAEPVLDPAYHLWRKDDHSSRYHWVSSYQRFGHEQVMRLEGDLARFHDPREILQMQCEARSRALARGRENTRDLQHEKIKANKRIIGETVFGEKSSRRDGKIFSAPGVSRRGSTGQVEMSSKELGWELPEKPAS